MMSKKNNKTAIIAVAILLVLVVGMIIAYFALRPTPALSPVQEAEPAAASGITIGVTIRHADGSEKELSITTEAANLRGALEQENLVQGDVSEYGLFVTTVDGEFADTAKTEWWCFTKGGDMLPTGVDDTLIADGEHYEIVFTVGW